MRCSKCDTEMFNAKLTANNLYPVILTDKENGIFKLLKLPTPIGVMNLEKSIL